MNKISKIVVGYFKKQSLITQAYIFSEILNSASYTDFCDVNKSNCINKDCMPYNYLINFLSKNYAANTINGRRRANYIHSEEDKLKLISVWMPNGRFAPSDCESFQPLGRNVQCTKMMLPYVTRRLENNMIVEWNRVKHALCSKSIGKVNEYTEPRLDYEPTFNADKDVYFVLDRRDNIVKIGASNDVVNRLNSIKRFYKTGELDVVSIIKSGGFSIEKRLHKHFSHLQLKEKGREWFEYNEEMRTFIDNLNSYPIKSRAINSILG